LSSPVETSEGCAILHFLGDSHLRAPRYAAEHGWFEPWRCQFTLVGGATAIGLRHPTSRTQALTVYRDELLPLRRDVVPIFQLGEVDCGFVVWLRGQRYGESIEAQVTRSLDAYHVFLREMKAHGYTNLIVTSAILPTIRDGQLAGEVAHLRREVKASHLERTTLTVEYNRRLQVLCEGDGLRFVDFTSELLDAASGLLDDRFRHSDRSDHHLDNEVGGRLWVRRILAEVQSLRDNSEGSL